MAERKPGSNAGSHLDLGRHLSDVERTLADLDQKDIVARIWRRDHTVWKPNPEEISDRLGWLDVTREMEGQLDALSSFASEVQAGGYRHVVLLGMGGSSLGPEVLRQTFGSSPGYPELIVLDSTTPAAVSNVAEVTDPGRTLFLVSSKSGTTLEPMVFYRHFRGLVKQAVGEAAAGESFVAITDPATPLASMAETDGFRRVFLNPPDMGGRYSVLSYFGLVPAALMGIDVAVLLDRAGRMRQKCGPGVSVYESPAAWAGVAIGALALRGVDKLTVITSPQIASFGVWLEQLLAESAGKDGRGVVPVTGEPLMDAASYDNDRLFVYLRLEWDDNTLPDRAVEQLIAAGQPVMRHTWLDRHDIGAEFFRWEFATAVAGAILGIHPFNQPDVQSAKDATARTLQERVDTGRLPDVETSLAPHDLAAHVQTGDYVAILAYLRQTPQMDDSLSRLRRTIAERHHVATTAGYGPRYLHSTGQRHKGGPDSGVYLFVTAPHENDLPIPGEPYSFGDLADAQALGDQGALQSQGRRVARLDLGADGEKGVHELAARLAVSA